MSEQNENNDQDLEVDHEIDLEGFQKRLVALIDQTTGGNLNEFSARTGGLVKSTTMRNYVRGDTEPKISALAVIAKVGNCTTDWLLHGVDKSEAIEPKVVYTPKYASELIINGVFDKNALVKKEDFAYDKDFQNGAIYFSSISFSRKGLLSLPGASTHDLIPENLLLISVDDYVMSPTLNKGDVALINPLVREPDGGLHFILYDGRPEFRRVQKLPDKTFRVISDNPSYPVIDVKKEGFVKILGSVLLYIRSKMA